MKDEQGNVLTGRAIAWNSSSTTVATIDAATGVVTGVAAGTATLTATSEGKAATVTRVVVIKYRSISAGTIHACDIASGGIVWCWGLNGAEGRIGASQLGATVMSNLPVKIPGDLRFTQISTYGRHTCGITFRAVSAGADHTCGAATDNRAFCWGNNDWRQLGSGTVFTTSPTIVSETLRFNKITAGTSFTCGITTTNETYCWGANQLGQVGDGGNISYGNVFVSAPQKVVGGKTFQTVTLGNQFACALTQIGESFCWAATTRSSATEILGLSPRRLFRLVVECCSSRSRLVSGTHAE